MKSQVLSFAGLRTWVSLLIMAVEPKNTSFQYCSVSWKHGYDREFFWISGVLLLIVGTIGIFGNIFSIVILCQNRMRKTTFFNLLLVLCCFDILFLLSYGSVRVYDAFSCNPADYSNNELLPMGKVFAWPLLEIGWLGSIYMTVAISLERYIGICRPNLLLSRRAFLFIIPVVLISFGFSFPRFLEYELIFVNGTMVGKKSN